MKQRILQFVDFKGLSARKFCDEVGISHSLLGNNSALGSDKLEKISAKYVDLNMDWVIAGRGPMLYEQMGKPYNVQEKLKAMMEANMKEINAENGEDYQLLKDGYEKLKKENEELRNSKSQMLVGSDEGAKLAIQVQKDQITELQAKLIKCLEQKEKLVTGYVPSLNEPDMKS